MSISTLNNIGWVIYVPFLLLALRLTWEKIYLTWVYGEQNIGFSLAHGAGAFLLLAPMLSFVWSIIALGYFLVKRNQMKEQKGSWTVLVVTILTWVVLYIPFDKVILALKPVNN